LVVVLKERLELDVFVAELDEELEVLDFGELIILEVLEFVLDVVVAE
jgi:hypothetical protein